MHLSVAGRRAPAAVMAGATLAAAAGGLAACGSGGVPDAEPGTIRVVAAENFWGDIARQIGGNEVSVTSLITSPNTDPHTFDSNPRDAVAISTAQLVIDNGAGYDDFVDRILATGGRAGRRVLTVQRVLGVTGSHANPHFWYWTAQLPKVAAAIARQLSAIDPRHAGSYRAGAQRFDRSLRPLLATIATIRRKYAGTPVGYTERLPGYLVQAAGLHPTTPASFSEAIEQGNDPSPQDTAAFDRDITAHNVDVLLYNSQVVDAQTERIRQLASHAGVPTVGVSETMPTRQDFQRWQLAQDRALLRALGG